MKRFFIISICLLGISSLVSCSKTGMDGAQERIAFSVAVGTPSTKSKSVYSGGAFGSYAWKTSETWGSTPDAQKLANPYMANAQTTYDSGESKWYPESFRWPSTSSYLHFACYAPYKVKSPMTYSLADGICFEDYTIDYSAAAEDLLYSDLSMDKSSGSSSILFHHALCQIVVKLQTDAVPSGLESVVSSASVTLKSLSVSGIKSKGDFTQNGLSKWSSQSDTVSHSIFSGSMELTTTPDESCAAFYVIPQAFEDGIQTIRLTYDTTINYSNSTSKSKNGISEKHDFYDLSLSPWEPGKQVTYTITVSAFGDELSFSARTENWTNQSISGDLGGGIK